MSYERSVSASSHRLTTESVWGMRMPEIRFGPGAADELAEVIGGQGVDSTGSGLVVTDENLTNCGHTERVVDVLETAGYEIDVYDDAEREPSITAVEECIDFVHDRQGEAGYDFYVGLGGGSCLDTAKTTRTVVANGGSVLDYVAEPTGNGQPIAERGPPLALLPTTAGTGSEISPIAVLSVEEKQIKEAISDDNVRADVAVLDPRFTTTLPPEMTGAAAMDALGHAIEGYTTHSYDSLLAPEDPTDRPVYAGRTPATEMFSEKAIALLSGNVRTAVHNGDDLEARSNVLLGALFGAIAGLSAGAHLCHAMAYPVGNRYHTFHGETIAALTPATTLGYNVASDPERFARIARMLGADTTGLSTREAADTAHEEYILLQQDLNVVPSGLNELAGITEDDVDWLAAQTISTQQRLLRCNPRPVTVDDVREAFRDSLYNWE